MAAVVVGSLTSCAIATPKPAESVLFHPTFLWRDRSSRAGTAFVATIRVAGRDHTVLVTCFHVLGDHPEGVLGTAAVSIADPTAVVSSNRVLPVPGQARVRFGHAEGELCGFELARGAAKSPLTFSAAPPRAGDTVYLFALAFGQERVALHRAIVTQVAPDYLEYAYDETDAEFGGTSGAPVVNESGEVVGINVSGTKSDGRQFGFANPSSAIVPKLTAALTGR